MEKEQVIEFLTQHGYKAKLGDDGIPYVYLEFISQRKLSAQAKEIGELLRSNGYMSSYGWKITLGDKKNVQ